MGENVTLVNIITCTSLTLQRLDGIICRFVFVTTPFCKFRCWLADNTVGMFTAATFLFSGFYVLCSVKNVQSSLVQSAQRQSSTNTYIYCTIKNSFFSFHFQRRFCNKCSTYFTINGFLKLLTFIIYFIFKLNTLL